MKSFKKTTYPQIQLIKLPELLRMTARSKSSNRSDILSGVMIPPISIGARSVAYIKHEVEAVIQARIEGQAPEQIKALVQELIKQRKQAA